MSEPSTDSEPASYFDRACRFFRRMELDSSPGSYLVHNKNRGVAKIGLGGGRRATVAASPRASGAGLEASACGHDAEAARFEALSADLDWDAPCFFLISGDFKRDHRDESLPIAVFVQPRIEFRFSADAPLGDVGYALDPESGRQARRLLRDRAGDPDEPLDGDLPSEALSFDDVSAGWERLESDEAFLARLDLGIQSLREHPEGKMTMMRAFRRRAPGDLDPFALFRTQARDNGEYACSHFFCLGEDSYSLGCSPESSFEIIGDELHVDVVAATCKSGQDEAYEKRELTENPKQIKEHLTTAETRESRYAPYCAGGRMALTDRMRIKRLRNVCHLHSLLIGTLLPKVTMFDIASGLFPIMGSRPKELLPVSDSETSPHRYYGGIVGHWEPDYAGCFLNLRNALVQGGVIHAKVGMGVLRESDARSELAETEDKIAGLMEAVFLCSQGTVSGTSVAPEKQPALLPETT